MKHKFLVLAPLIVVLLLLSVSSVGAQDFVINANCSIDAPAIVNEGQPFTAYFVCMDLPGAPLTGAYGFQLGSTITYNGPAGAVGIPTSYNAGDFSEAGARIIGNNAVANYAVTRTDAGSAPSPSFILGTLSFTTTKGVLEHDEEVALSIPMGYLKIGNRDSQDIHNNQFYSAGSTVTIVNLFSLDLQVQSEGLAITSVSNVRATVGSNVAEEPGPVDDPVALGFDNAITPGGNLVRADMKSHLACRSTENVSTDISGWTITLKPGDVDNSGGIFVADAQAIALAFGPVPTGYTGEADVDASGKIDILDMIYVGRNYNSETATEDCVH